jgi:hypothetical protein
VNKSTQQKSRNAKRRIENRLDGEILEASEKPMFAASNIQYEIAGRMKGLAAGGIGAIHQMARALGLIDALDDNIHLLKVHLPYHESDHILNIAYNVIAGGTCLEDLELRRNDEVYMNALGTLRIPDPTTAGDFCRRFVTDDQVVKLMDTVNQVRLKVWKRQPTEFLRQAVLHADGTLNPTDGECKQGMNIFYNSLWGYHPLLISLAQTKEVLYLVNRPGNRPSYEQADKYLDKAIGLCREGGFQQVLILGDTDFTQSWKLDEWDSAGDVKFILGIDAMPVLKEKARALPESAWKRLERPARYQVATEPRTKPENVKERIVRERGYKNLVLLCEDVAEFDYQPGRCNRGYRIVALRKLIAVERGQERLFKSYRYFFYITNQRELPVEEVVFTANSRCDQENLIEQMKNGIHAMHNALDNLHSNWAYMVIVSLAWTFKGWFGLLMPAPAGPVRKQCEAQREEVLKMEFKRFVNSLIQLPCQIVRTGRRIIYRLLAWNPWVNTLIRMSEAMRCPLRC